MTSLTFLPCTDSDELAEQRRLELQIDSKTARERAEATLLAINHGYYMHGSTKVEWHDELKSAVASKISIAPDTTLPSDPPLVFAETKIQVSNETTLQATKRLVADDCRTLALNFANGTETGGGFLRGARAQEEALCRASGLYATLLGDAMYDYHHENNLWNQASAWCILSPNVPVFREEDGSTLAAPWLVSFITCAAPYAPDVGQPRSRELLKQRIHRVLSIAVAYQYSSIVLGAWGCGAFYNDVSATAHDFREALEGPFAGSFSRIVFAICDWSAGRETLGPFAATFCP